MYATLVAERSYQNYHSATSRLKARINVDPFTLKIPLKEDNEQKNEVEKLVPEKREQENDHQ